MDNIFNFELVHFLWGQLYMLYIKENDYDGLTGGSFHVISGIFLLTMHENITEMHLRDEKVGLAKNLLC